MHSDSKSTTVTSSGAVFAGPARVVGIYYVAGSSTGSVIIKDGGSGGTQVMKIATPAGVTLTQYINLSGSPIRCETSAYATLSNVTSCMVVYN
jgi:type III secretory pathway component EscU